MSFKEDFIREKLFLFGVVFIILGGVVFFGATPRRMSANPVGGAWVGASVLVGLGLTLLGIDYYLNR